MNELNPPPETWGQPTREGRGMEERYPDSNTSTYIVVCLVELRVSAPSESEAIGVASEQMFGANPDTAALDIVNVSLRVEDPPGRGCCRDGVYGDWRDRPGNYGE